MWPPEEGLCSPTVSRKDTILQTTGHCTVAAPASTVWAVLRDTAHYPDWNTFAPSVTILSQPDGNQSDATLHKNTRFILHVQMGQTVPGHGSGQGGKRADTQLRVTDFSTPDEPSSYIDQETLENDPGYFADLSKLYRIAWTTEGLFVRLGVRSERFHEIIVLGPEECEVRTWECQGGVTARAVKWMFKDTLARGFQVWCDGLKKQSEEVWGRRNKTDPAQSGG